MGALNVKLLVSILGVSAVAACSGCAVSQSGQTASERLKELQGKYNELSRLYNEEATRRRNVEREYRIFRNQLVQSGSDQSFEEAVRIEIQIPLYSAKHFSLRSPVPSSAPGAAFRGATSLADFLAWVSEEFECQYAGLLTSWDEHDRDTLRALYSTWVVSTLWGAGAADVYNGASCIIGAEEVESPNFNLESVTFGRYQDAESACCTDYAVFLKFVLDSAGVVNRIVILSGHISNEAFLQGRWWSLDSMAGVAIDRSRAELDGGQVYPAAGFDRFDQGYVNVYWLQIPSMNPSSTNFRASAGAFRIFYVVESLRGRLQLERELEGDDIFGFLPYGRALRSLLNPQLAHEGHIAD